MNINLEEPHAQMELPERLILYSLVVGLQPRRVLEIGTKYGGSAVIIAAGLAQTGDGELVCIDPEPDIAEYTFTRMGTFTLLKGKSPDLVPEAVRILGGLDLAWIDGDHSHEAVKLDIGAVAPWLSPGGVILLHDAHQLGIAAAIREAYGPAGLTDCGLVATAKYMNAAGETWGGIHMLRKQSP
jgi:predicted O-methyltransferase YrrM